MGESVSEHPVLKAPCGGPPAASGAGRIVGSDEVVEFGVLVETDPRAAWPHEAHQFTPWLAQHLHLLSEQIGIPLELEGREVAVQAFYADILARNLLDDSLVLIENQLSATDHGHLGQIMTYLAGLGAQTVVWIATEFREPHLSALRWLNDHTAEAFAFFAVRVKVVRIGRSPFAPVLEVVVRPNGWERRLQSVAQATHQPTAQFRRDFWNRYVERHPEELGHGEPGAVAVFWRGVNGTELVISLFVGRSRVGLFVRGYRGVDPAGVHDLLAPHAERLGLATGATLEARGARHLLTSSQPFEMSDRAVWNAACDWLKSTADRYEAALVETVGGTAVQELPDEEP